MPSKVALSSIFGWTLKILCNTFNYLYLFEGIFSSSLQGFSCFFCMCLCYTLEDLFHTEIKKESRVIIVWSGLKKVYFIFYWKEMIGNSLNKDRLDMDLRWCKKEAMWTLERCSKPSLSHEKWKILFTNLFQKLYLPLCMCYRTFLEWLLIAFLQSKYLWSCFYW